MYCVQTKASNSSLGEKSQLLLRYLEGKACLFDLEEKELQGKHVGFEEQKIKSGCVV